MQRNLKFLVTAVLGSNYIKKMTKITSLVEYSNNSSLMKIPKTGLSNFQLPPFWPSICQLDNLYRCHYEPFSVHVPLYTSQKTLRTKNLHLNWSVYQAEVVAQH